MAMTGTIHLKGLVPLAQGCERRVYFHEAFPEVVFKVLIPLSERPMRRNFRDLSLRFFPSVQRRIILKEYMTYLSAALRGDLSFGPLPITELRGMIQTDLGPASIAERISTPDRIIGPTLTELVKSGQMNATYVEYLNDFAQRLVKWQIRTSDLTSDNIVFGLRDGVEQFVLVDAIGDHFAIPIRTWSVWANTRGQSECFAKIARKLGMHWDAGQHLFTTA